MKTVTVINHSSNGIVVHKVGCADIERERRKRMVNSDWPVEVSEGIDIAGAVADDLNASFGWPESYGPDEDAPWSPSNITVMPCVGKTVTSKRGHRKVVLA